MRPRDRSRTACHPRGMGLYAQLLRLPHVAVLLAATTVARLPIGINGLAVVLYVREVTGSFAIAGLATGALALGTAVMAPLAARLVDRRGARMLIPLAFGHAGSLLALWALGSAGAPGAALAAAAFSAGAAFPPSGAVLRSRWPDLIRDPGMLRTAYAFDSVVVEFAFVTGPLLTAVLVALVGPQAALGVSAALVLVGTTAFLDRLPGARAPRERAEAHRGILGPLGQPAILVVALTTLPVGFCLGAVEVALPAFSDGHGSPALAGILLAVWSGASGVGGLVFGARHLRSGLVETYLAIALLFPLACLPLVAASSPLAMAALAVLAGLPIAPLIASRNQLVGARAPRGAGAESFTWLLTALVAGSALGAAVTGALAEADSWRLGVLVGVGLAAGGAALALAYGAPCTLGRRPAEPVARATHRAAVRGWADFRHRW
ncbi:MAG: MFS transporter [Solirubrobacterales bacterium]|nr:MFS transporter [Solirubrobacterales bacterium]